MYKILSVEDDLLLLETIEDFLCTDYQVECARSAKEALALCYKENFDLYLWDINLPDTNGIQCLKMLRESGDKTPAIFLTSATNSQSVESGFLAGGDDYIKKPFNLEELSLRIKAVLRRSGLDDMVSIDEHFTLNPARKILLKDGEEMHINPKDFKLLLLLVQHRGKIVTKDMIVSSLWCRSETINESSIRVYVNNLKKIFGKNSISNIRGVGYRFHDK